MTSKKQKRALATQQKRVEQLKKMEYRRERMVDKVAALEVRIEGLRNKIDFE